MLSLENMRVLVGLDRKMTLSFDVCPESTGAVKKVYDSLKNTKLSCEIKKWRNKRSLDANAYFWLLTGKIAEVLKTDKDSVYLDLLDQYGVFRHYIGRPEAVEMMKKQYRLVKELGEVTVNGQTGIQFQCFFGSSSYDTGEMSRLVDGAIQVAESLGIPTLPDADVKKMKEEWGV